MAQPIAGDVDDAPSGVAQARVEPEHTHPLNTPTPNPRGSGAQPRHDLVGDFEIRIHVLHVITVFKRVEQLEQALRSVLVNRRRMHKKPNAREIRACLPWLEKEIEAVTPQILVCLGATAAQALLDPKIRVTRDRGVLMPSRLAPQALATVHPSSILRQQTSEDRHREMAQFIEDLRVVARALA